MKVNQILGVVLLLGCLSQSNAAYPETREYLLGDIDGFQYNGPGSVDDVYVDPVLWNYADLGSPTKPFDITGANQDIPFTFLFPLEGSEQVTGATLTVGLRATDSLVTNDWLVLHPDDGAAHWGGDHSGVYEFPDLGWLPISFTGTSVRSVDLANILGDNRLPFLQDGRLNIHITDDTAVDYALLTIEVIPEPATLSLLALGVLALIRRRY